VRARLTGRERAGAGGAGPAGRPDLLVLDEPSGGLDADGVTRVASEIRRAADRRAVVLVARHPTAPAAARGADLGLVPFAVLLALAALVAPLISQGSHPHPLATDLTIVGLHLAAAFLATRLT